MIREMPVAPWGLVIGIIAFVAFKYMIIPAWTSPLNKVPAANALAPFTSLWMTYKRYQGKEFQTIEGAFKQHGEIVRLGPKELAINFIDGGIRTVYGRGYHKPSWYDHFINYGRRNIISTLDETHGTVRRRVSSVYAKSFLQASPHFRTMVSTILETRLLPMLSRHHECGASIDALELSFAYGIDMVTTTIFGLSCSTNLLQDEVARKDFLDRFADHDPGSSSFWLNDLWDVTCMLDKIGLNPVPAEYYASRRGLENWCLKLIDSAENLLVSRVSSKHTELGDEPIVYQKLRTAIEEESKRDRAAVTPLPLSSPESQRVEIASECLDHIIATREDFGITLAAAFHIISRHPECQVRMRQELSSVSSAAALPTPQALESLPYFNAVIKECLRLRPNPPTPNPRITPPGQQSTIGPYKDVPPGVRVVAFARCLHRNESVFPDPTAFVPERWLRPAEVLTDEDRAQNARVDEREEWYWTFGSGSRMCLASNMAMEMIRMALAAVYPRFSTAVEDDTSFGVGGDFVQGAASERLLLKLTAVNA